MKTFQVEDTYLLLTEFEVRTVSYGPYQWSICGPREKNGILNVFSGYSAKKNRYDVMLGKVFCRQYTRKCKID